MQVFVTRADWSRRALTQPEMMDPKMGGKFNTTEIHCTEYHPAVRAGTPPPPLLFHPLLTPNAQQSSRGSPTELYL